MTIPNLDQRLCAFLDDNKADDIVSISLKGKSSIADYLIIASGQSQRHIKALGHKLKELLHQTSFSVHVEGSDQCDWVLLDAGDVIIHLFKPEIRSIYNLEKMWGAQLTPPMSA